MKPIALAGLTVLATVVIACSTSNPNPAQPSGPAAGSIAAMAPVEHSLVGSGLVRQMPGLEYRNEISARLNGSGGASGKLIVNIQDISIGGLEGRYTGIANIDCLEIDGDQAWFGGVVVEGNNDLLFGTGRRAIGRYVKVSGVDYFYSGPTSASRSCHSRPALRVFPVEQGQFRIR